MADSPRLPASALALVPREEPAEALNVRPGRPHLVVVITREVGGRDKAPANALLMTRFWHPRDHRWSENFFESLEHAVRLFVDESGWVLRQQQALDRPHAYELVFEARREDFTGPSTRQILEQVGLDPSEVEGKL
ncbi:MAG TPA: hypothetical protein VH438_09420 [Gemmatimonadales bacterium]